MDRELENQIDQIVEKSINDLKIRIYRVYTKHLKKISREHLKELKEASKSGRGSTYRRAPKPVTKPSRNSKYHRESEDSEDYYSE